MKVILTKDVKNLGRAGDVKDVAEGYARNFLIPKKLAEIATAEGVKEVEAKKASEQAKAEMEADKLRELAAKVKGKKIILKSKEKNGKLFGSITAKDIADELQRENLAVSTDCIIMKEALKKTGTYEIRIALSKDIESKIILEVSGE